MILEVSSQEIWSILEYIGGCGFPSFLGRCDGILPADAPVIPWAFVHAAWLKVNRINRLTGRRVLKARWVENFILNVISCPATTVQISQGFGARQLIKLFAHILLMLFGCFAMNMLIYNEPWSRLSTLFSHFHFRCLAGERTLSLRRRVMLDCRLHSCFVFFLFFFWGGDIFSSCWPSDYVEKSLPNKGPGSMQQRMQTVCRDDLWFEMRWVELKTGGRSTKPVEEQNLLICNVISILGVPDCLKSHHHINHPWCHPVSRYTQTYQTLQLHLKYLIPRLAVIYSLVIPDPSIFPLAI